jgi:hypothetical protein
MHNDPHSPEQKTLTDANTDSDSVRDRNRKAHPDTDSHRHIHTHSNTNTDTDTDTDIDFDSDTDTDMQQNNACAEMLKSTMHFGNILKSLKSAGPAVTLICIAENYIPAQECEANDSTPWP